MLVKVLGGMDIAAGLILIVSSITETNIYFFVILGVVMLLKSLLGGLKDFGGWIDRIAGFVLIISAFFPIPVFIAIIIGILVIQKGVFSFV